MRINDEIRGMKVSNFTIYVYFGLYNH